MPVRRHHRHRQRKLQQVRSQDTSSRRRMSTVKSVSGVASSNTLRLLDNYDPFYRLKRYRCVRSGCMDWNQWIQRIPMNANGWFKLAERW